VSECRQGVYLYEEDDLTFKIYFSKKEVPYLSDGIKGKTEDLCEVFLSITPTTSQVEVYLLGEGGQMNYQAVTKSFYLSFSYQCPESEKIDVTLTIDGKEQNLEVCTVLYDGVISSQTALKCVQEYDQKLISSLTSNCTFNGEIYIRLLYDKGCYYYVGICDKQGTINSYLVDGESGRIITTRKTQ
jgi:hypothetical protein